MPEDPQAEDANPSSSSAASSTPQNANASDQGEPEDLEGVLDRIRQADEDAEGEKVSMGEALDAVGHRSFGPLLLVAGLVTLAPVIGDIPGVPAIMAVVVLLTAGQMILRRDHIWLPNWLLGQDIEREKLEKTLDRVRRPARWVDRWIRPRLTWLVQGAGAYGIAFGCLIIALALPPMEFIPFSANLGGAALTAFALALIARDGVLALIAYAITLGSIGIVLYNLI